MSLIGIKGFNGLKPIVESLRLDTGDAQVAMNVRLISGAIAPMNLSSTLKALTTSNPKTIYRYGTSSNESNFWLEFGDDTDVMRSPISGDQYERLYWTVENGSPRYAPNSLILSGSSYPGASYLLGIPAPSSAPSITNFTPPGTGVVPEARTYVYTYVSAYGEEGPPSPASSVTSIDPSGAVTVSSPSAPPSGAYNITHKRIYRSSTVGSRAAFQFVAEVAISTGSYIDSLNQSSLGEVLPSEDWVPPPTGLKGLRLMANGAAVGFKSKTLYFSEPNLPHAWPHEYTIDEEIVGIATFGQMVAVMTKGFPYIFNGIDPSAMVQTKLREQLSCSSKRSIIETDSGAVYASPQGLVSISGSGVSVITKSMFSRQQWLTYTPSSMDCYLYNGRVLVLYNSGGSRGILIFDLTGQGASLTTSDLNASAQITAGFYDPSTDKLYFAQNGNIVRFDDGSTATFKWRSKVFRMLQPENLGVAQVRAESYPVTFKVYADGVLRHTKSVQSDLQFRLPSGFRAIDWVIELEGSSKVTEVFAATSPLELKAV